MANNNYDEIFITNLNLFKNYISEYNQLPSSDTIYNDFKLGQWLRNQRNFERNGKLSLERIQMLNDINPYWNASNKEKEIENKRLLLTSDWKSKVPEGHTPIDEMYQDKDKLYYYISRGVVDCESLITRNYIHNIPEIYKCYSKIIPIIDANYALLLSSIFGDYPRTLEEAKIFFESFPIISKDEMINKMNQMINLLNQKEKEVICLRYCIGKEENKYYTQTEIANMFNITTARIRQIEVKAIRKLRHPSRTNIITKTGTILDNLSIHTRSYLYRLGIDSEEKINNILKDYIITNHAIRAELETLLDNLQNKKQEEIENLLDTRLRNTKLSVRSHNALTRRNFNTVRDIKELCDEDPNKLLEIRNLGLKSASEILTILNELLETDYQLSNY